MTLDRTSLKAQLRRSVTDLGTQIALLPAAEPSLKEPINQQVQALTAQNPTPNPLESANIAQLIGTWELIYASQGTVVTRRLGQSQAREVKSPVTLQRIWQVLRAGEAGEEQRGPEGQGLQAENGAQLAVPVVGVVQLRALGTWTIAKADRTPNPNTAQVAFQRFGVQGLALGPWQGQGPELLLSVLPVLQRSALWRVVYLDEDLYIGEGKTGNRFVFSRSSQESS
ncbi:MAG: PAP/fibrillin family protein [Prochlorothrix sp.]